MTKFKAVVTTNLPDDEIDDDLTITGQVGMSELLVRIGRHIFSQPEATSFVIVVTTEEER
jgi:hypothetical protein